jgi:ABC-type branched-subunit amino acid transport system ATPase component
MSSPIDPGAYDGTGLRAEGVVVRFGGLVALGGVTVEAPRGRITGLIGPNGAGKTTMFNVCCGFQKADEGTVTLDGKDISSESPARRARLGIGRTFQRMELFGSLTVRENVELAAEAAHVGDDPLTQLGIVGGRGKVRKEVKAIADDLIADTGLGPIADRLASEISAGQGRLVELARALARGPNLLLLDEPSSGLDPGETEGFAEVLHSVVGEDGCGILLVEHDMSLVRAVCEYTYVLDFGKLIAQGTTREVLESDLVRAAYLGEEEVA